MAGRRWQGWGASGVFRSRRLPEDGQGRLVLVEDAEVGRGWIFEWGHCEWAVRDLEARREVGEVGIALVTLNRET